MASRIRGRMRVSAEVGRNAHPHMPHGRQFDVVVDRKLTPAVGIEPPQALLPQKRTVERRLHFVHAQVLGRRPDLAPQHDSVVVPHRALHENCVVFDLVRG